jgi:drug/metabolite transporter (DMT)-like permease
MKPSYLVLLIAMNFLWSATLSIYNALKPHLDAGGVVTLRFAGAALTLVLVWPWLPGRSPRGYDLLKTAIMGVVVFVIGHRLQVYSTQIGAAGDSAVLMGLEPLVTSVAAAIFLREHIGPRRWMGFALGMAGVLLLHGLLSGEVRMAGIRSSLIFVSCFISEAAYSVMGKKLMAHASYTKILALGLVFGTIGNLLIDGRHTIQSAASMTFGDWMLIAYMSTICTAFGYALWFAVIQETDVNVTALTIFAQPLAGLAIAAVWLHEPLHIGQLWGGLAIVAGLIVGLSRQIKPANAQAVKVETIPNED